MVSDGCGDCAKRLPQRSKMQTKRAIIKLNLHGTADYALAALEAAGRVFGWPRPELQATVSGTSAEVILAGPEPTAPLCRDGRLARPARRGAPLSTSYAMGGSA